MGEISEPKASVPVSWEVRLALAEQAIKSLTEDVALIRSEVKALMSAANKVLAGIVVACILLVIDMLLRLPALTTLP